MSRGVAITGFGRFSVTAEGGDKAAAFSPRARRCLAHLALRAEAIDRGTLAAELWPETPEGRALGSLRRRLHELESALASVGLDDGVERTRNKVALAPKVRWSIDVTRYEILARDPGQAERAAALYEEPIFPGFDDDVVERERRRLRALQVELLLDLLELAIRRGDAPAIALRADALLRLDPLSEQSIAKAVAALNALGQADRARRLYERFAAALHEEADAQPAAIGHAAPPAERYVERTLAPIIARGAALRGPDAARHFDEIERRLDEIRAALDAAIVHEADVESGVRALAALSRFFFDRGHSVEAFRWYDAAIPRLAELTPLRAEALYLRAMLGRNLGAPEHNLPAFEQAIAALRISGDRSTLAKAMLYGSNAARMTGRTRMSEQLAREALAIVRESGDEYLTAFARSALGTAAYALGDLAAARRELEAAREGFAGCDARDDEALMIVNVGRCAFGLGDLEAARQLLHRALERASDSKNVYVEAHASVGLALLALDAGDLRRASTFAARSAEIALKSSDTELSVIALEAAGELFLALGEFARARDALAAADGVRSEFLLARAPTEHARSERLRAALAQRSLLIERNVAAHDIMMRSLLQSVARSYAYTL